MGVARQQVIDTLAVCDVEELRLVLQVSGVGTGELTSPRALAERIGTALWWSWCTPLGFALDRVDLDQIVTGVARRLRVPDAAGTGDAWARLDTLNRSLRESTGPVALTDLPPDVRARAHGSMFPSLAWSAGSVGSFGLGAGARAVLGVARHPIGRLLPFVPYIGPGFVTVRRVSSVAAVVGTPLSVAFAVLAVNQALGRRWRRVLPLLLSVGALGAHHRVVTVEER